MKKLCIFSLCAIMIVSRTSGTSDGNDALDEAIRTYRMGTLVIKTAPGATVQVRQLQHEFWFGTCIAQRIFTGTIPQKDKEKYLEIQKNNFNSAVHENAMKWYSTERNRGVIDYHNADVMLKWCEDNGLRMRGHCVYWAVDEFVQDWIKKLDDTTLYSVLERRATDLLTHYKGRIPEYDINNEMIHGNYYTRRLGNEIRTDMFQWCKKADPGALLYVNDYNIMSGDDLDKYEQHIEALLEAGVPVGGIGIQGHFRDRVDPAKVKRALDRLSRFNLPIKITEFDILTLDEDVKAQGLKDVYSICFAHPSVTGILMWGFWAGSHWRSSERWGIPEYTALWDKDWNPTPAAKTYRDLFFRQWWTDFAGTADDKGICEVQVFYGRHRIVADNRERIVAFPSGEKRMVVDLHNVE